MDTTDPNERDSTPLRIAKFIAIIVVLAVICGGLCAGLFYLTQYGTAKRSQLDPSRPKAQSDPMPAFKGWFFAGATVGACLGLIYTGRCIIRNEDP